MCHVATVAYCIVSPIGLACLVVEVVGVLAIGIVVATGLARTPRLITDSTMVEATRTPAEEINPAAISFRNVTIVATNIVILFLGKLPCVCGSLVLQVALREVYL